MRTWPPTASRWSGPRGALRRAWARGARAVAGRVRRGRDGGMAPGARTRPATASSACGSRTPARPWRGASPCDSSWTRETCRSACADSAGRATRTAALRSFRSSSRGARLDAPALRCVRGKPALHARDGSAREATRRTSRRSPRDFHKRASLRSRRAQGRPDGYGAVCNATAFEASDEQAER